MKKIECQKCHRLITANNHKKHFESCDEIKIPFIKIDENWKIEENIYKCPFCEKTYTKHGIISHIWRKHTENGMKHKAGYKIGRLAWNKGLTKDTDERVKRNGDVISDRIKNGQNIPYNKGKTINEIFNKEKCNEIRKKIGEKMTKNNNGGKCKWFSFFKKNGEEIKLQGTWEVRFAKVLELIDENWIKIGVGHKGHSFMWKDDNDKEHFYTPDFYSPKLNKYFEVKGYWWGHDKLKMEKVISQNNQVKIEIVMKNELTNYEKLCGCS